MFSYRRAVKFLDCPRDQQDAYMNYQKPAVGFAARIGEYSLDEFNDLDPEVKPKIEKAKNNVLLEDHVRLVMSSYFNTDKGLTPGTKGHGSPVSLGPRKSHEKSLLVTAEPDGTLRAFEVNDISGISPTQFSISEVGTGTLLKAGKLVVCVAYMSWYIKLGLDTAKILPSLPLGKAAFATDMTAWITCNIEAYNLHLEYEAFVDAVKSDREPTTPPQTKIELYKARTEMLKQEEATNISKAHFSTAKTAEHQAEHLGLIYKDAKGNVRKQHLFRSFPAPVFW